MEFPFRHTLVIASLIVLSWFLGRTSQTDNCINSEHIENIIFENEDSSLLVDSCERRIIRSFYPIPQWNVVARINKELSEFDAHWSRTFLDSIPIRISFFKKYNFQAIGSSYVSADKNILDEDSVLLKALMQSLVLQKFKRLEMREFAPTLYYFYLVSYFDENLILSNRLLEKIDCEKASSQLLYPQCQIQSHLETLQSVRSLAELERYQAIGRILFKFEKGLSLLDQTKFRSFIEFKLKSLESPPENALHFEQMAQAIPSNEGSLYWMESWIREFATRYEIKSVEPKLVALKEYLNLNFGLKENPPFVFAGSGSCMGEMFEDSHDYTILDKSGWPIDSGTLDQLKEKSKYWGTELNLFVCHFDDARTFLPILSHIPKLFLIEVQDHNMLKELFKNLNDRTLDFSASLKDHSEVRYLQLYMPAYGLRVEKNSIDFYDLKTSLRKAFGWQDIKWNKIHKAFQPKAAVEAVTWFRL